MLWQPKSDLSTLHPRLSLARRRVSAILSTRPLFGSVCALHQIDHAVSFVPLQCHHAAHLQTPIDRDATLTAYYKQKLAQERRATWYP